jgi:predicted nucleic acid-binding protein
MNYALDSNAIIAFLRDEPGSDVVEGLLLDPSSTCFAHAINLCEVYYDAVRVSGEADAQAVLNTLANLRVVFREEMDPALWQDAARLKAAHRRVSLADCFCLALARRVSAELVTSDHREFDPFVPLGLCPIRFIR